MVISLYRRPWLLYSHTPRIRVRAREISRWLWSAGGRGGGGFKLFFPSMPLLIREFLQPPWAPQRRVLYASLYYFLLSLSLTLATPVEWRCCCCWGILSVWQTLLTRSKKKKDVHMTREFFHPSITRDGLISTKNTVSLFFFFPFFFLVGWKQKMCKVTVCLNIRINLTQYND